MALSPDLVEEEALPQTIAKLLGVSEADAQLPEVASRITDIEVQIDEARAVGRLTRYERQLKSGAVLGHVYKRDDLIKFLRSLPASVKQLVPNATRQNAA